MELNDVIGRYRTFYSAKGGCVMVKTQFPVETSAQDPTYLSFDLHSPRGVRQYYDAKIAYLQEYYRKREQVEDDCLPELFVHLGTGAGGAVFGEGEVLFSEDTSWFHPASDSYSALTARDPAKFTSWGNRFLEIVQYVTGRAHGLTVAPFMHFSPLDAANALRGNEVFYDFYEQPEQLTGLLKYCKLVVENFHSRLMDICGSVQGGQSMWNVWIPGARAVSFMEDTSNLCSPQIYRDFGRAYTASLISKFRGGFIHNHMLGRHQFANIASIPGLGVMNIANDPKCARVAECLPEILADTKAPINFECTYPEFMDILENNVGLKAIAWVHCENASQARLAVAAARKYSERAF